MKIEHFVKEIRPLLPVCMNVKICIRNDKFHKNTPSEKPINKLLTLYNKQNQPITIRGGMKVVVSNEIFWFSHKYGDGTLIE